jgi:hypothetical protein
MKRINFEAAQRACAQLVVSLLHRKVRTITLPNRRVGPRWAMAVAFAPACIQRRGNVARR